MVEVIVGTSLILIAVLSVVSAFNFFLHLGFGNIRTLQAAYLLEEGIEATLLIRDDSWANISSMTVSTPYFLSWSGSFWQATPTEVVIDQTFERTVTIENVYRDADNNIASSGTLDNDTKKITVTVYWGGTPTPSDGGKSRSFYTYLTNSYE